MKMYVYRQISPVHTREQFGTRKVVKDMPHDQVEPGRIVATQGGKTERLAPADIPEFSGSAKRYLARGYWIGMNQRQRESGQHHPPFGSSNTYVHNPDAVIRYALRDENGDWPGGGPYEVPEPGDSGDDAVEEAAERYQVPNLSVERKVLTNGKVEDTMSWTDPPESVVGIYTRRSTDGGVSWWTHKGYVADPEQTEWSSKDDAGEEWSNRKRWFQARYDFGDVGKGPWCAKVSVE